MEYDSDNDQPEGFGKARRVRKCVTFDLFLWEVLLDAKRESGVSCSRLIERAVLEYINDGGMKCQLKLFP